MSGGIATTRLVPPLAEQPINPDTGDHNQAWIAHHQDIADALANVHKGVIDGSDAATGQVGEAPTASSAGAVTLSNNTAADVATLPLAAGDWDVSGVISFNPALTTHPTQIAASLSLVSSTLGATTVLSAAFNVGAPLSLPTVPSKRFNVTAATTVYLVALATFTTAGMTATGTIWARRMR